MSILISPTYCRNKSVKDPASTGFTNVKCCVMCHVFIETYKLNFLIYTILYA